MIEGTMTYQYYVSWIASHGEIVETPYTYLEDALLYKAELESYGILAKLIQEPSNKCQCGLCTSQGE